MEGKSGGSSTSQVTRRTVVARGMAAGALALSAPAFAGQPKRRPPNILFILADDLGYADLSCYGRRDYKTPALDRLAAEGLRFTQAYANSAVCSATRTALITGRYQDRLAVGLEQPLVDRAVGLPPDHPTLPSLLKAAGYRTALVGKWHLGKPPTYGPLLSGYEQFWGIRAGAVDYFSHDANGVPDLWDNDVPVQQSGYMTDLLGGKATALIETFARDSRPFFLSLHFTAPHWPWQGPDDVMESQRLAANKDPRALSDFNGGSMARYAAMVKRMDDQIGHILATIERCGLGNDTIVVFTSDNGGERFSDTWPFSGKKTELLEGGVRVPAIVRWPGAVKPGMVSEQVAISMDWLPTLLAAAGLTPDPAYPSDGIDLGPALRGAAPTERTLFWRYLNLSQEACRSGHWKYLKILDRQFLFNLRDDPLERANLKDREPQRFARLSEQYRQWSKSMLPLDAASATSGFIGAEMADHFGVRERRNVNLPAER